MFVRTIHGRVAGWGFLVAVAAVVVLSSGHLMAGPWPSNPFDPTLTRPANPPPIQSAAPSSASAAVAAFSKNPFQRPNTSATPAAASLYGGTSSTSALSIQGGTLTNGTGAIAGSGIIKKTGTGTLILSGSNTYTGTTTVNAGTLQSSNATCSGSISIVMGDPVPITGAKLTINPISGGSITLGGTLTRNVTLNSATGSVLNLSSGALTVSDNASIYSGTLELAPITGSSVRTIDLTGGTITTRRWNIRDNVTGGITKSGTGTLTLSDGNLTGITISNPGANYTLSPTIVDLTGSAGIGSVTLAGTIRQGATLTNSSSTGSLTTNGTGTLTVSGNNTYTGATTINSGILKFAAADASSSALIGVSEGTFAIANAGALSGNNITLANSESGGVLNISALDGSGITAPVLAGELQADSILQNTLTVGPGATITLMPIAGGPLISGGLTAVPEPSTIVLIFIAGLGLLTIRKLRHYFRL
jgi:fibronectin-binding autotransporter adhesin